MKVAILGGGAGGYAAAAELSLAGHSVALWGRSAAPLAEIARTGSIGYRGAMGDGAVALRFATSDIEAALDGAACAVICTPAFAHAGIAAALARLKAGKLPLILNPGHAGGALELRRIFSSAGSVVPPVAELSTLIYVARKHEAGVVTISGRAKRVGVACLPGGTQALDMAHGLFPNLATEQDVIRTSLSDVNMVLHPPGAILGASWIEATKGDFTFYVEGMTDGVARVMEALDMERRAVAAAFGHDLPSLPEEMRAVGTVEDAGGGFRAAISGGAFNREIRAPDSLKHRYFSEDLGFGLVPLLALARAAEVETPIADSLLKIGITLVGDGLPVRRDAQAMGIGGLGRDGVLEIVAGGAR